MTEAKAATSGEKNRRVIKNIAANLLYELIVVAFGLILPRLYLLNFGSDVNGLDNTIKNIFAYLALLEAGVGLSAQYALYRPVAEGDTKDINSILSATRIFYLKTGVIYLLASLFFAAVYPLIIKTELSYFTVFMVILLYSIPGVILFLLRGKYTVFLDVEGKRYILTVLSMITLIISNVLRLVLLMFFDNLILVQATYCVPSVIQIIAIEIYVKRKYPWINFKEKPDFHALSQKKSVLIHQISGCIFSNTDTIIISVVCGMSRASVYAIYALFFSNFQKIVNSFTNSMTFKFGQLYQIDKEKFRREFGTYETVYYTLMFAAYTVITAFLAPVIKLYTEGVADAAIYNSAFILVAFAVSTVVGAAETPQIQLLSIAGKFDDTKNQAVWEMCINIAVSVPATVILGIPGCLLGTVAALVYRTNALMRYSSANIVGERVILSYKKLFVNILAGVVILCITGVGGCEPIGYIYIMGRAILSALWILPCFIMVNLVTSFNDFKWLYKSLKKN